MKKKNFLAEAIRNKVKINGKMYYEVKWVGLPENFNSLEQKENLPELFIEEYENQIKNNNSKIIEEKLKKKSFIRPLRKCRNNVIILDEEKDEKPLKKYSFELHKEKIYDFQSYLANKKPSYNKNIKFHPPSKKKIDSKKINREDSEENAENFCEINANKRNNNVNFPKTKCRFKNFFNFDNINSESPFDDVINGNDNTFEIKETNKNGKNHCEINSKSKENSKECIDLVSNDSTLHFQTIRNEKNTISNIPEKSKFGSNSDKKYKNSPEIEKKSYYLQKSIQLNTSKESNQKSIHLYISSDAKQKSVNYNSSNEVASSNSISNNEAQTLKNSIQSNASRKTEKKSIASDNSIKKKMSIIKHNGKIRKPTYYQRIKKQILNYVKPECLTGKIVRLKEIIVKENSEILTKSSWKLKNTAEKRGRPHDFILTIDEIVNKAPESMAITFLNLFKKEIQTNGFA